MEQGRRPLLASGRVVEDYGPLLKYVELARQRGLKPESYSLTREDIDYVSRLVIEKIDLASLLSDLKRNFMKRLDCGLASEAYRESKSIALGEREACEMLASIYAGWLIEACETLGILRIREAYKPGRG
ncbi:hypothetical protein ACSU1N_00005 [Thermogladius sp. 4427co]|uniref:hypothetical protein n=1 Tax=Thermogladius sp. 4427co TaxID=3450718 RepID=UPI003F7A9B15